jgi:hypothetical protein
MFAKLIEEKKEARENVSKYSLIVNKYKIGS